MLKKFFIPLLLLCLVSSIASAQEGFDIGYIDLNFCDGTNHLVLTGDAKDMTGFCFTLENLSATTGMLDIALVDGEMTLGANPVQACKTTNQEYFSQFVQINSGAAIVLPPNTGTEYIASIKIPDGFAGNLYGCLTMTMAKVAISGDASTFSIVNRKANLIDIQVAGLYVNGINFLPIDTYTGGKQSMQKFISSSGSFAIYWDAQNRTMHTTLILVNTGYAAEEYTLTGNLVVSRGKLSLRSTGFDIQKSGTLYGGQNIVLQDLVIGLPWWVFGNISASLFGEHQPMQAGLLSGTTTTYIHDSLVQGFIYPTIYVSIGGCIILILLMIVFLFIRRKKRATKRQISPKKRR